MHFTICIVTRNRSNQISTALKSMVALAHPDWDVVIVDQSQDDDTWHIVSRMVGDDLRFRYVRSNTIGSSVARNIAISEARGPLLAFTDDDCEVLPGWLDRLERSFQEHDDVGLIYGSVISGPHDPRRGFIPDCPIYHFKQVDTPWQKWRIRGIGANMACRVNTVRLLGGFDEILGSGGPLHANLDGDLAYRMLRAGYAVLNVSDAIVVHHGFRPWEAGRPMLRGIGIGVSATYMKHIRLGDWVALPTFLIEWRRCVYLRRLFLFRRPWGFGRFIGYGLGALLSFHYSIDHQRRVYLLPLPKERGGEGLSGLDRD
ncbi:MAG TPA: glycosyltransferase family 2 protein [Chloroflexota bacterium]|nr:glycosyltransferase family 2 protein [Chloroflexota bacterium]